MAFPPPGFLQNLSAMASHLMNMNNQGPYQMPPMYHHPPMGILGGSQVSYSAAPVSISAPPVRKITTDSPSLLGAYPGNQQQQLDANFQSLQQQQLKGKKPPGAGPTITVFVGNITERASDMLIRQLLSKCGTVNNWKRVQGANGKLQAFGFCEYSDPESAMRAIRLLHEFEIVDKKLVVKVDAKTKDKLDEYCKIKCPGSSGSDGAFDESTRQEDKDIKSQLIGILKEHEIELARSPDPNRDRSRRVDKRTGELPKPENLADMEMEEEKRSLIHREIDKFRDTYKKLELEKEKVKEKERERDKDPKRETDHDVDDKKRYSREKVEDERSRDSRRLRTRDKTPVKDRSSRKDRYSDNRNDREDRNLNDRPQIEDEEDAIERRRLERKMREKEASYQTRLRNWEARENRKIKEYEKEKAKEDAKKDEETKESRRLKQFLEDYDDDRDDPKFYRGSNLSRRLREREKENEEDNRDKRMEKKELEELRRKLSEEGHPDPESEAKKRLNSGENNERDKLVNAKIRELMSEARLRAGKQEDEISLSGMSEGTPRGEEIHVKSFSFVGMKLGSHSQQSQPVSNNSPAGPSGSAGGDNNIKRKKLSVSDVFNPNDDDDANSAAKKRRLPALIDDNTDSNQSLLNTKASGDQKSISSEEKRKQIKALIEKIPTSKEELFKYEIDWPVVDANLMEKRIRPWINKKITEYIGEEEQALLDFICTKLQARSAAQSILDDVAMVLDDEAEVFVVKMWRLLIYEIEAKKLGIGK